MATRTWPVPPGPQTIHFIGDIHCGVVAQARLDKVTADLASPCVPVPATRFQIGDLSESGGNPAYDTAAKAFLDGLPGSVPWYAAIGNHDLYVSGSTPSMTTRSVATWLGVYGSHGGNAQNWAMDLGFCVLLVVNPDSLPAADPPCTLSAGTLTWLDTQLTAYAGRTCLIVCHTPLANTVQGGSGWNSTVDYFEAHDDTAIRAVIAAHGNAKAWIAGHTHSPIDSTNLVMSETIGSHAFAHINTMAIRGQGSGQTVWDGIVSTYVTVLSDRIQVRWRHHGRGVWVGPVASGRVTEVLF